MDKQVSSSQDPPPGSENRGDDAMLDAATHAGVQESSRDTHPTADLDAPTQAPAADCGNMPVPIPGQRIDDYELVREIARGGMGVVYLAKQLPLNRFVALKMVLEGDAADAGDLQRFANEAQAAGALDHPGIVRVYEVGSHNGCPYFSMAFVDGQSVAAMLVDGPLKPMRAAEIAKQVAVAISHAHDQQIIHRDLKPANILIDQDGQAKITDFGVCKSLQAHSHLTSQGELIGTPHYMPPEQAGTPDAIIGPASDVYSIGAVLYAMLTARPPFQAPSPIEVVTQVMTKDPVPPSQFMAGVQEDLETITLKCMAKSPKDRYPSARLLADDLDRFLSGEPILAKPPGLLKRLQHSIRRHVFLASVSGSLAITLVLLAVLLGIALLRSRAKVAQLTELVRMERAGARRLVIFDQTNKVSLAEYDVFRLTDAAAGIAQQDRQLALNLAVHAGRLALKHQIAPPDKLTELLPQLIGLPKSSKPQSASFEESLESAAMQIHRELTEFEITAYGLLDPSHDTDPTNESQDSDNSE